MENVKNPWDAAAFLGDEPVMGKFAQEPFAKNRGKVQVKERMKAAFDRTLEPTAQM